MVKTNMLVHTQHHRTRPPQTELDSDSYQYLKNFPSLARPYSPALPSHLPPPWVCELRSRSKKHGAGFINWEIKLLFKKNATEQHLWFNALYIYMLAF